MHITAKTAPWFFGESHCFSKQNLDYLQMEKFRQIPQICASYFYFSVIFSYLHCFLGIKKKLLGDMIYLTFSAVLFFKHIPEPTLSFQISPPMPLIYITTLIIKF